MKKEKNFSDYSNYLKLKLKENEFYLTNALTRENLDKFISDLKNRYSESE